MKQKNPGGTPEDPFQLCKLPLLMTRSVKTGLIKDHHICNLFIRIHLESVVHLV